MMNAYLQALAPYWFRTLACVDVCVDRGGAAFFPKLGLMDKPQKYGLGAAFIPTAAAYLVFGFLALAIYFWILTSTSWVCSGAA